MTEPSNNSAVRQVQRRIAAETLVALTDGDLLCSVGEIAREVADREPLEIQLQLESYLTQVPQALRQSLRRPEDPSGKTVGARFDESPEHIAQMLPQRLPRFKAGDRLECLRCEWELVRL